MLPSSKPSGASPAPHQPPFGKTVVSSYPTPQIADAILVVLKQTTVEKYKTEEYGTEHPDQANYAGYELSLIVPDEATRIAKWYYVADRKNQERYNYAIAYSQNDPDFPIVTRRYILRRAGYSALPDGTADTAFSDTQLTTEKTEPSTGHPELDGLYILVTRVFETLPGQWNSGTQINEDGTVSTQSRRNIDADITTREEIVNSVWTRAFKKPSDSAYVSEEVQEIRVLPGKARTSQKSDPDGILVTIVTTLKDTSTITAGEPAISGGVWSETVKEPVSQLVAHEVVKSRALPGRTMVVSKQEQDGATTTITRTLKDKTTISPGETPVSGGLWTKVTQDEPPVFRGFELRGGSRVAWEVVETRAIPGNPLPATSITKDGDIVTETKTLKDATVISTTTAIVSGVWTRTFKEPFPGSSRIAWEIVQVRSTAYALPFYSVEIPDVIPAKMRAALPLVTTETIVKGTATQPTLLTGDFYRSQQQLDQYTYRLKITNLAVGSLPISITDKSITEKFGGGPTTVTYTLSASSGAVDEGLLVLSSTVDALGNSLYLKTTDLRDGSAWPTLFGTKIDKQSLTAIQFTSKVVDAGITGGVVANVITDIEPIDYKRSRKIVSTIPTSDLDTFSLQMLGTASFQLPNVLTSITGVIEKMTGTGGYTETGSAGWIAHGSWSLSLRGSGRASASILPDVIIEVQQPWANEIPVIHLLFFMPSGSSIASILTRINSILGNPSPAVTAWPKFRPVAHTLLMVGKRMSIQVDANNSSSSAGDGTGSSGSATSGTGEAREVGISFKSVHIPPTIHGALSIATNTDSQAIGPVTASINVGYLLPSITRPSPPESITGYITPTSLAATDNGGLSGIATSIPTTGKRLYRVSSEPYSEYPNYIKVHCEIVDFADIA